MGRARRAREDLLMAETGATTTNYEEVARRLAAAIRATQLYATDHPLVSRSVDDLLAALRPLLQHHASLSLGIVDRELVVADLPLPRATASLGDLIARLTSQQIERISFDRGVTAAEIAAFAKAIAALSGRASADPQPPLTFPHIRVGRLTQDERRPGGIANDMAAIRELYAKAVSAAEVVWESAQVEGTPDVSAALQTIEGLTDAVAQNRTALVALTAMRTYDNYTFTHMVNVSILTMGQARALGIEGRLLREFGLSALMHDIGKVRTPTELLNKTEKLTDAEFAILRRHVVDGAEILRRTPEMPILAPVVAFEHHLRQDGSGYPSGVTRGALNLGTMLCSIADVYDAMRSQRSYQQAFPTDRILAVYRRAGDTHFDPNLVRRFVQLLGIYPPGTLVQLQSGGIAVVTRVHAPDPYRPRVRMLFNADRSPVEGVVERNLWAAPDEHEQRDAIVAPLDPQAFGIDPLVYVGNS
jgi:putative nucleotidyltransferase with HDIG domain